MKHTARKLLSLLMVLAMMLTMLPAAFAAEEEFDWEEALEEVDYEDIDWGRAKDADECEENDWDDHDYEVDYEYEDDFEEPDCETKGWIAVICKDCGAEGEADLPKTDHDWEYEIDEEDPDYHYAVCSVCDEEEYEEHNKKCDCDPDALEDDKDDSKDPDGYDYAEVEADEGLDLDIDDNLDDGQYKLGDEDELYVEVEASAGTGYTYDFEWNDEIMSAEDAKDGKSSLAYIDTDEMSSEIVCTVTATKGSTKLTGEVTWYVEAAADLKLTATIYNSTESYAFGDPDDDGNDSLLTQLEDELYDYDEDYLLEYVKFSSKKITGKGELDISKTTTKFFHEDAEDYDDDEELFSEVEFIPDEDYEGTVSFGFTAYCLDDDDDMQEVRGEIEFDVLEGGTGLGIVLSAEIDDEVELDVEIFEKFWEENYPDGELASVKFGTISKGKVYYDYDGDDETNMSGKTCYVSPKKNQIELDSLTYVPAKKTTSATISFTAAGVNSKDRNKTASGSITILYTENAVTPVKYEHSGEVITLETDDFVDLYKDVMDVDRVTNIQIQFLNAPVNGSLYYNYGVRSGKITGTQLVTKNIGSFKFSSASSSSRSIEDVTYVPGTKATGDTLEFACYAGSTLKFIGTVEFAKADPVELTLISSTNGVTFTKNDFFKTGELVNATYITFGNPVSGTLYMDYNGKTGTKVTSAHRYAQFSAPNFGYYDISTVTYVPAKAGTAKIPFTATTANEKVIQGTLTVTTVVNRFPDLKSDHWAFNHIMKLVGMGVVGGDDKGNVNPAGDITYGEVLKIVMKAAGYADQKPVGTHWASGYLSKAVDDGLISASTNLDAKADRNAVATLTCKTLKLGQAAAVKAGVAAPVDSNNGYVYALYNAGILTGSNVNGVNYFKGGDNISRAEAFTIVSRVYDYMK